MYAKKINREKEQRKQESKMPQCAVVDPSLKLIQAETTDIVDSDCHRFPKLVFLDRSGSTHVMVSW